MPTATVTSKGQITIPLPVRNRLGLRAGDRIDFLVESGGRILLQPKRTPFENLRGILKTSGKKLASVREMDRAIERALRMRWERVTRTRRP